MNKYYTVLTIISVFIFVVSLLAMVVQEVLGDSTNLASIIGGILSMIGGISGALGAYFASVNQTRKEFERRDNELKKLSRPIINCAELHYVNENLSNIKYPDYAILLSDQSFINGNPKNKMPLYIIQFLGNFKLVLNVEITIVMDDGTEKIYPIGGVRQENEILLGVPTNKKISSVKSEGGTDKIIISYFTETKESFKYVYDNTNLNECYYLISNNIETLERKIEFKTGTWQIPGRYIKE